MKKYEISKRHVKSDWGDWDNPDEVLKAIQQYELGYVEICQAKTPRYWVLYCIPRKIRDARRRAYFSDGNYYSILVDRCSEAGVPVSV